MLQTDPSSRARQRLLTSRNPNDQIASRAELTDLMRQAKFSRTERENVASAMRKSPGAGRAAIERISKDKTAKDRDRLERETKHRVSVDVEFVGEAKNWLKRSRLGNDDRFVNAENARKGKSLANSLFAEAGAPASKRERQRIVQMAQEDPKGFAEQVDHDNLRYEGEDRNPAAEANDWMMGKIVDPATFGMASRANEAGEDIADEIQETGIPDLSPWKGAVPW